ncbi:hypothetical protein MIND_01074400 [Mycena indigotica]|uniref:Phytase-like domain-containing protein n=1 Tax=Mycena indigotica TaxID=2126181 RepID=A0A8H6SAT9_9AGAR|nr:uncharacterized protein MIND_01074400 [Mycena indigotica]KAF7295350.1 hypothetical protein MIND_01074400 [Mycena indigotica]
MPSFTKLFTLFLCTAIPTVLATPTPKPPVLNSLPADCTMNHGFEVCHGNRAGASSESLSARGLTNAQRLARGLPLKPPTRRASARRATTSPSPVARGYIQVVALDRDGNSNDVLGFVSRNRYQNAQYLIQPAIDDSALLVTSDGPYLILDNDPSPHRFVGLVQGREDDSSTLAEGSSNYLYLAASDQTSSGSSPQSIGNAINDAYSGSFTAESAVWTLDPITHRLAAQWTNTDSSRAPTLAFTQGSAIYFTADLNAFQQAHSAPIQRIAFVFITI